MRWVQNLRLVVVLLGVAAGIFGTAYAVNAMTQAPAYVKVPVTVADNEPLSDGWADVAVDLPGVTVPSGWLAGARPAGSTFGTPSPDSRLTLVAWDSTRLEQLLSRGDWLVGGLGVLAAALVLRPVLDSIAGGRPFAPGNSRRLVALAAIIAGVGAVAPLLPQVAGFLVLERTGLAGPRFMATPSFALTPILVGVLVLALAAAFRIGERMTDDVRGLV